MTPAFAPRVGRRFGIGLSLLLALSRPARAADDDAEFFEKRVRPVLVENCQGCHGSAKQKGGLRLDSLDAARTGGDTGPALVPGKPDESLLIQAVRYGGELKMPPKGKLTDPQTDDLAEWVKRGAPWPAKPQAAGPNQAPALALLHPSLALPPAVLRPAPTKRWSLRPVANPPLPEVKHVERVRTPVDRFLLAKLEAKGLAPAPPADRRTLIRRVTFDLIGLPPTPAEVEAFVNDRSQDAYERVVERLLASPHYGERWARHWLDLVRYAETSGHEFDPDLHEPWRYRDYVVRAFNEDLPYDRFVTEHVAGDLLSEPRRHAREGWNESILATAFWFLGESKHSPVDVRQDQAERVDNQIDVFGKTFLGLTLGCARCHDHKFDPISANDYYALYGFLSSSRLDRAFIDDPARLRKAIAELQAVRAAWAKAVTTRLIDHLEAALRDEETLAKWAKDVLTEAGRTSAAPAAGDVLFEDFSRSGYPGWSVSGEAFGNGPTLGGELAPVNKADDPVARLLLPGLAHSGRVSTRLRGTLRSKTFRIEKDFLLFRAAGRQGQINLIVDGYQFLREPIYGGLTLHVNHGDDGSWLPMNVGRWRGHAAYIELVDDGDGYLSVDEIRAADRPGTHPDRIPGLLQQLLVSREGRSALEPSVRLKDLLLEVLRQWRDGLLPGLPDAGDRVALLNAMLANKTPAAHTPPPPAVEKNLHHRVAALEASLPLPRRALAVTDGTGMDERVFIRGNHKNLGEVASRRFLHALPGADRPVSGPGSGRLELARCLTDPANPLTARVMVNRLWHHHFGAGIVRSPDDFGVQGQEPTHPELLDWLAAEFVRCGWSVKHMHRLMVLSDAYRMESHGDPAADEADPQNKLLHRMPVRRLEAEAIRDSILAVSGRLDPRLEGPSVPPHLTPFMVGRGRPAASGPLDGDGRRSIYLQVRRNFLSPLLLAFDYPIPFTTMGRRSVSNVPAQALALLNNPFVAQQATRWAERVLAESGADDPARVVAMYRTALSREPEPTELREALVFLEAQGREYGRPGHPRAWADLAHVLFNLKEFVFIR